MKPTPSAPDTLLLPGQFVSLLRRAMKSHKGKLPVGETCWIQFEGNTFNFVGTKSRSHQKSFSPGIMTHLGGTSSDVLPKWIEDSMEREIKTLAGDPDLRRLVLSIREQELAMAT